MLTPGPTPVPEEVLLELAQPMVVYHRSARYRELLGRVTEDLKHVFQTSQPVLTLTASGTGGMEAALASALPAGAKVICLSAGRWGERWISIAKAFGMQPVSVTAPYGEQVAPGLLEEALKQHPDAGAVCATLCETATGVKHDVAAYGALVARTPALLLVDAISGLGAVPCRTEEWGVDLCVAGSQKGLMLPPGLAFVSVSPKAWKVIDANPSPRAFYFDLRRYRDSLKTNDSPFTPALSLVRGVAKGLAMMRAEGVENLWARYAGLAAMARAGVLAMNLELFAQVPAESMTVLTVPAAIDGSALVSNLEEWHGLKLTGGQDTLKDKIVRFAHMGYIDAFDVLTAISALELTLAAMGHKLEPGAGVAAAQRALHALPSGSPKRTTSAP
jgi:aspartate aminotransferase-like enzyme